MKFKLSALITFLVFLSVMLFFSCGKKNISNSTEISDDILITQNTIIPKPIQFNPSESGEFLFTDEVIILDSEKLTDEILYLKTLFKNEFNINIKNAEKPQGNTYISLQLDDQFAENYYQISCTEKRIIITGGSPESVFNGIQTIRQLLSIKTSSSDTPVLSAFELVDLAEFKWRGMLLDVCRHYFEKDVILKYIDLLAFYKFNVLHWHITEDQAWRIAIDKYPKLTEVGAWRLENSGGVESLYGGYYTKDDIREIVKYASERHIQIVPEIEMPGHASAAVAAYPFLGCNGEQIKVPTDWGVFKDIYCPTEETFTFLEDVLTEVIELFPSDYVHIGGDEAPKTRWEESEFCQNLMKEQGLHDYEELQSYFINRMSKFLEKNGKTIIGWDEILNDELTESAIIQSWRGMEGGKRAVSEGRQAIMSPTSHCYLDYSLKAIDTEKIYHFEPIPEDCTTLEASRILGAECNMWTEHVPDENTLDSKVFPRLLAASEAFWSSSKDYPDFTKRLDKHYSYLDKRGVKYGAETIPITISSKAYKDSILVSLKENLRNPSTTYSISQDQNILDGVYLYNGNDIAIKREGNNQLDIYSESDDPITAHFQVHNWLTAKTNYSVSYSDYYTGGGKGALSNGALGSLDFRDGNWQGYFGDDIEITLENPNENKDISEVSMNFYRYINSWIFPPESVSISISSDGISFTELDRFEYPKEDMSIRGKDLIHRSFTFDPINAPFLKVSLKNIGKVPHWHEASGEPAWVFIDEIIVK